MAPEAEITASQNRASGPRFSNPVTRQGRGTMMKTLFMLMAQHDGKPILPVDVVCKEYFAPMTLPVFLRKVNAGEIALPLVKMERSSQKGPRLVHIEDLAAYIDERRAEAKRGL